MNLLISLVVVGPLVGSATGLLTRNHRTARDLVTLTALGVATFASWLMLFVVEADGTHVAAIGSWSADLGIILVADLFAVLVLPVALTIILVVELFAIGQRKTRWGANPEIAGPLLCALASGVSLSMLTGDLFTLFVAFEIILVSSYVLLTNQGQRDQTRSGMTYVSMNLLSSTLFLFGVAFVYSATGTVNFALMAERLPELPNSVRLGIGLWFFVVFGTKAAVFPLFSWLPDSYPTAPTTITAVFAGLLTKIGIYSMIRFHSLMGMNELGNVMLAIAGITMVVGAVGALAQRDIKRILSFHIISQIGYMLMGLGLFTNAGLAGATLFLVHHMPVKTVLFLVGGLVENEAGTSNLSKVGGLLNRRPLIAALFAIPALSLAGLPPFSGFAAKFAVISAAIAEGSTLVVVASIVGGVLTLLSMSKIWLEVFWGKPPTNESVDSAPGNRAVMYAATTAAVAGTLAISLLAGPIYDLAVRSVADLDAQIYSGEVLR